MPTTTNDDTGLAVQPNSQTADGPVTIAGDLTVTGDFYPSGGIPFVLAPPPTGVDDTAALQALLDSLAGPIAIALRPGTYILTPSGGAGGKALTVRYSRTKIIGAHPYVTAIQFNPSADDQAAIEFNRGGTLTLTRTAIAGVRFTSANTTLRKIAMRFVDCSQTQLNAVVIGPIGGWTGNNSIGLHTQGRDFFQVDGMCSIAADRPVVISANAHAPVSDGGDADHFSFCRSELIAAGANAAIEIESGCTWSQMSIDVDGGAVNGSAPRGLLRFVSTTDTQPSTGLFIRGCRYEGNTTSPGTYTIELSNVSGISNGRIETIQCGNSTDIGGIKLRNAQNFTIDHMRYSGLGVFRDIDATCGHIIFSNCYAASGATETTTGMRRVLSKGRRANSLVSALEVWESTSDTSISNADIDGGTIALVNGVATGVMDITLPASMWAGGQVHFSVEATDGTDFQERTGVANYAAVNKAGAYAVDAVVSHSLTPSGMVGTLTVAFDQAGGANKTTLRCTATSSLAVTALRIRYSVAHHGAGGVVPL